MTNSGTTSMAGVRTSVLVVEDDLGIATQLVRGLRRGGYDADHVTTGGEALRRGDAGGSDLADIVPSRPCLRGARATRSDLIIPQPLRSMRLLPPDS